MSTIYGCTEDYCKIIVNAKHELILNRSRNDLNAIIQVPALGNDPQFKNYKVSLTKIEWLMP